MGKHLAVLTSRKSLLLVLLASLIGTLYLICYPGSSVTENRQNVRHGVHQIQDLKESRVNSERPTKMHAVRTDSADAKTSKVYVDALSPYKPSYLVEESNEHCMEVTNLKHEIPSFYQSQQNARYFYDEFKRVIPNRTFHDYLSHCWSAQYSVKWSDLRYSGHVSEVSFRNRSSSNRFMISYLTKRFPTRKFESNLLCLPNIFLAGFPKCGSSFLYCFINKLIDMTTSNLHMQREAVKEPHFWVRANAAKSIYLPTADDLGEYLLNFLSGLHQVVDLKRNEVMLVDGTPNIMFNWPRFRPSEHDLTNYCLIPSVLPNLLPDSKYIVIMRNPIDMVYSAFWFSCTSIRGRIPMKMQHIGPSVFHDRVRAKISMFNNCMKDSSVPSIDFTCVTDTKHNYSSCIMKRMHLLDRCINHITFNIFSRDFPGCGRSRIAMGVYYVHVRKWLSVVSKHRLLFLTLEDLAKRSSRVTRDIIKFLGVSPTKSYKSLAERAKDSCKTNSQDLVDYKHNPRLQMRGETRTLLDIFYHPFNTLLGNILNMTLWNKS